MRSKQRVVKLNETGLRRLVREMMGDMGAGGDAGRRTLEGLTDLVLRELMRPEVLQFLKAHLDEMGSDAVGDALVELEVPFNEEIERMVQAAVDRTV